MSDEGGRIDDHQKQAQPFLYPWNRRLRHLHGISLRNLNIGVNAGRNRGRTITDDKHQPRTTATALLRQERKHVQHVKSYGDLVKASTEAVAGHSIGIKSSKDDLSTTPRRPGVTALRRRSTLHWSSLSIQARQVRLEAVEELRLVDSWFSIHVPGHGPPVYISEVVHRCMNPDFSSFDLETSLPLVVRSERCTIKVWSKCESTADYQVLVQLDVDLSSLSYIGKSLETFYHPLPENCVLVHLSDGIYTQLADGPLPVRNRSFLNNTIKDTPAANMASPDTMMKLTNIEEVYQDTLIARSTLEADITSLLAHPSEADAALAQLPDQRERTNSIRRSLTVERKHNDSIAKTIASLRQSHQSRRDLMQTTIERMDTAKEQMEMLYAEMAKLEKELAQVEDLINGQHRRVVSQLSQTFPIEPVKNKTLQFTIRGVHLPNSNFNDTNRDEVAAALGYTAQLVHQLALYLRIPLPYPIKAHDAFPAIRDNISASIAQRLFPLHPGGTNFKFEYGVFLLNKDIEYLMNSYGMRVMDTGQTLPNLKYLLFVLTAGSGELPMRKIGGIRGLLRGFATPEMSRRNSDDSIVSQASTAVADRDQEKQLGELLRKNALHARALPYRRSLLGDRA